MIEVKNLTKRFGKKTAVDHISFTVNPGEILGFLGPNAAGKSTTMRMITGFLTPTSGTVVVGDDDITVSSLPARKKIGYLPENAPVYTDMSVTDFLHFIAEIRGFSGNEKKRVVDDTIEKCFLPEVRFQAIGTLSKGYKQRVCFAQSILHDPPYLIMDEPTDGLDPNQKHEVRGMLREMGKTKTIILSTHILDEVEAVCTRAIIIANGKIVADDTPEGLKSRSTYHGAIRFTVQGPQLEHLTEPLQGLTGIATVQVVQKSERETTFRVFPKEVGDSPLDSIKALLKESGHTVDSVVHEEGRLDEVFRTITTQNQES
jgi:ABC-2 type transport system ATP-binding protein